MKITPTNFINIQGFMRTELNLTGNDLLVYAIIWGFSQDGDSKFSGSLQYLADWCGATKQGIQKNIKNLLDRGLIKKETKSLNGMLLVSYYTTELHGIQLSCTNNTNISSNTNITNNQQELFGDNNTSNNYNKEKMAEKRERARSFVDQYNSICKSLPKCQRMTPRRSKAIHNLLDKFTDEEILEVFNNLENSDFCKGKNDRGWRADIDFLLREDKFVSILEGKYNGKRHNSFETISSGDKKGISDEEREDMRKAVERGELKEY